MLELTVTGDGDLRDQVRDLAMKADTEVKVSEKAGFDGLQALQMTLEYGPPAVALIKSVIDLVEAALRLKKKVQVTIGSKSTD